ncbi:hypothetical protein DFP78_104126 [Photobacterium lutimaris]|nr:hypothetical protein DFP78_104126 [Photobacterium lutimaris]
MYCCLNYNRCDDGKVINAAMGLVHGLVVLNWMHHPLEAGFHHTGYLVFLIGNTDVFPLIKC